MENKKNTIVIILLIIIILILGYVAFLKPQNANKNDVSDTQIPVTNIPVQNPVVTNSPQNNLPVNTNNPVSLSTTLPQYIGGQSGWPPVIENSVASYSCAQVTHSGYGPNGSNIEKIINGKKYCITSSVDAAAGHRYGTYVYTTANGSGTKMTSFILGWPSCGGYGGPGDPQYNQCQTNQDTFFASLDALIASLM
ncbi:MAG: hypothetical protein NTW35_00015 [Candidatus Nomurabacteria bacterium]|nr:hypothetical protein [Candidatus Nomurabacteria bacterium]